MASVIIPAAVGSNFIYIGLFIIGCGIMGFYALGLAIQGNSFDRNHIVMASATFTMFYGIGALITPLIVGLASDAMPQFGFFIVMITLCSLIIIALVIDWLMRRSYV